MEYGNDGGITAFLIGRAPGSGDLPYGGGPLQEWRSANHGESWERTGDIIPRQGLLCNNPKPVEDVSGATLKRSLVFFGWEGPGGILPEDTFTGSAYLWQDGNWL